MDSLGVRMAMKGEGVEGDDDDDDGDKEFIMESRVELTKESSLKSL